MFYSFLDKVLDNRAKLDKYNNKDVKLRREIDIRTPKRIRFLSQITDTDILIQQETFDSLFDFYPLQAQCCFLKFIFI